MKSDLAAIEVKGLTKKFKKRTAVEKLDLTVPRGCCYGFFGPNGAGKTTTIRCILGLLRPQAGSVKIFGHSPFNEEEAAKSRLSYVPETISFYPWMSVEKVLTYTSAFYPRWNDELVKTLLHRFEFDPKQKVTTLSKGQKAQLSLIGAIGTGTELLVLDEPTSGLDPLNRREFIKTIIGTFQDEDKPDNTIFVSTHLINEFEGLIEQFTILNNGQAIVTNTSDEARNQYKKIHCTFAENCPDITHLSIVHQEKQGNSIELTVTSYTDEVLDYINTLNPTRIDVDTMSLEEIFIACITNGKTAHGPTT